MHGTEARTAPTGVLPRGLLPSIQASGITRSLEAVDHRVRGLRVQLRCRVEYVNPTMSCYVAAVVRALPPGPNWGLIVNRTATGC